METGVNLQNIPRRHRLKHALYFGAALFILVHLAYGVFAFPFLSLGSWILTGLGLFLLMLGAYALAAYFLLPWFWRRHFRKLPPMPGVPNLTHTHEGIPGDPLNVGLIGTEAQIVHCMVRAGWSPADSPSFETVMGIVKNALLHKPDPTAPVSNLYLGNRKQDLAFERLEDRSVKQRHHVRFWRTQDSGDDGRPYWVGAATFDRGYRLSGYTGQVLHRIAPEVDAERDKLMTDLTHTGEVKKIFQEPGLGLTLNGRNGEGDWYYTDGQRVVAVLGSS